MKMEKIELYFHSITFGGDKWKGFLEKYFFEEHSHVMGNI